MSPTKFHGFNQTVRKGITENPQIPATIWLAHPDLIPAYLAAADKYEGIFHEAGFGSRPAIAQRDMLQVQIVSYLDQIASILEAVAVNNPEVLLTSGFDLTKERRARTRAKGGQTGSGDVNGANEQHGSNQGAPSSG